MIQEADGLMDSHALNHGMGSGGVISWDELLMRHLKHSTSTSLRVQVVG